MDAGHPDSAGADALVLVELVDPMVAFRARAAATGSHTHPADEVAPPLL